MKLAFLDSATMGMDLDLSPFSQFGELTVYDNTLPSQLKERIEDVDIILVNKVKLPQTAIEAAKKVKLICIAATGMDIIDVTAARAKGVAVMNVAGYSTDSVAQTTFMLLLSLVGHGPYFNNFVQDGSYPVSGLPTHFGGRYFHELAGKRMGIIGLGAIGKKVAAIASAFGMEVVYFSTHNCDRCDGYYPRLSLDELLASSDVVSIHSPLNDSTYHLMGEEQFILMKPGAYLINMGRGAIVDEKALADALNQGKIAGAGIDVYSTEPIAADHPYYSIKNREKIIFSPHVGWASIEARVRLVKMMVGNIQRFLGENNYI